VGLSHLIKAPSETVEYAGGDFPVRALDFAGLTAVVRANLAPLSILYLKAQSGETQFSLDDAASIVSALATSAPQAVAMIIALCAAEPGEDVEGTDLASASALPFTVQIDALEKIAKLTFATEGGPKKAMETFVRAVQGALASARSLEP
jgi:hypothetical protein